uniref:Uncharacterized protein n=1 Tax=Meloidogyne enterolobii TaxID=390850 RepID=A0A6V7UVC9_MELEN|nr:unnamed protein product [Meloidogyne enterolobii]
MQSAIPVSFWNVNERALRAMAKTNNALDGLRTTARPEERDSEDVVDHENEFTGQDTSSLSLII